MKAIEHKKRMLRQNRSCPNALFRIHLQALLTKKISLTPGHEGEEYAYFVFWDEKQMALYTKLLKINSKESL